MKVIIIGDSGVGKTSLLESFNYKKISKSSKPTIGAEFLKKKVVLEDGSEVNLQLWDTAGQERFQSLCTSFYRGSDCCVLVFDLSQGESYENLDSWRETFISTTGDTNEEIPIVLIGNKADKGINIS
jgi:small GTP-binding protein